MRPFDYGMMISWNDSLSLTVARDVTKVSSTNKIIKASRTYTHHSAIVNDVQYHPQHGSLIGTVSDDLTMQILDTRNATTTASATQAVNGHTDAINALSFNPASEYIVATGVGRCYHRHLGST